MTLENPKKNINNLKFHWPILGHSQIKKYLQTSISNGALSHALLLYGPKNTGKFFLAYNLAASLICITKSKKKPCLECTSCQQLKKNIYADVAIIEKQEDKRYISINQIREINNKLSLKSFITKNKIAIINNADLLTEEAANALLKSLEEPHPNTTFILIANDKDLLPTTILSRCQLLQFNLVPSYKIENWLITMGHSKQNSKIFAQYSNGRPGLAVQLSKNKQLLNENNNNINNLINIIKGTINDRLTLIAQIAKNSKPSDIEYTQNILSDWLNFYRDIIIQKNQSHYISNIAYKDKIKKLSSIYSYSKLVKIINNITNSIKILNQSANPKLLLENLVLKI